MNRLTKLSRSIKNSVVLITGAASGMGKATAELFADEGAITIAADINKKGIEKVAFDRSGYKFHGRVKALAEAAREAGLSF